MNLSLTFKSFGRTVTVTPDLSRYSNGRLAIVFNEDGYPFSAVTVNMPDDHLNPGEVFIKDWSENEPLIKAMIEAGWLAPTGREVSSGYVNPKVMVPAGELADFITERGF